MNRTPNRPKHSLYARLVHVLVLAAALAVGATSTAFAEGGRGKPKATLVGTANINQASEEALELLPGIGPAMAHRIAEYRAKHPFKKVDDLVKVKGIGKKKMAKLRAFLTVAGQTTLAEKEPVEEAGDAK